MTSPLDAAIRRIAFALTDSDGLAGPFDVLGPGGTVVYDTDLPGEVITPGAPGPDGQPGTVSITIRDGGGDYQLSLTRPPVPVPLQELIERMAASTAPATRPAGDIREDLDRALARITVLEERLHDHEQAVPHARSQA